nr:ubinuclein-1-like isoform X2 [Ipomoea batatas]
MDEPGTGGGGESAGGKFSTSYEESAGRQRFKVKLTPGETTIVSWKKLLKDATGSHSRRNAVSDPAPSSSAAAAANQPLDSHIAPEVKDAPPGNRLNAVIEKIERLYVGKHSDDEEDLSDVPDEDEYDTDDSFIDDTELDEYFEVDNSAIKHDGFFVNRGNLERMYSNAFISTGVLGEDEEDKVVCLCPVEMKTKCLCPWVWMKMTLSLRPDLNQVREPTSLQIQLPEKRRRKDLAKGHSGSDGFIPNKLAKVAKDTGKPVPEVAGASGLPYSGVMLDLYHENDSPNITNGLHQSLQGGEKSVGHDERLNTGPPEAKSSIQPVRREASSVRRKGTMLEKAIRDLEKIVAESRPPNTDVQEADNSSQAIKRRLPLEIKHKLAKVARLATPLEVNYCIFGWLQQASHGKVSDELVNRLMSIVGHLIQLRTLKIYSPSPIYNQEQSSDLLVVANHQERSSDLFAVAYHKDRSPDLFVVAYHPERSADAARRRHWSPKAARPESLLAGAHPIVYYQEGSKQPRTSTCQMLIAVGLEPLPLSSTKQRRRQDELRRCSAPLPLRSHFIAFVVDTKNRVQTPLLACGL